MRKEKDMAEFFGYGERTIFTFKSSNDPKIKERYTALSNHKPFLKYHEKRRKK